MNDVEDFIRSMQPSMLSAARLMTHLHAAKLPAELDEFGEIHIAFGVFVLRISQRPHYCDRGRWLLHAESTDPSVATVDAADRFPRYYFNEQALVMELLSWKAARPSHATQTQ